MFSTFLTNNFNTYQDDFTLPAELLEQITSEGFGVLPELIRQMTNTAMQLERQKHLGARLKRVK